MSDMEAPDHRKGSRRRGDTLTRAVFEATLAELAEVGYAALTMEGVAERAHTGKASLYRRWPSRAELVVAAIKDVSPGEQDLPDTGDFRQDLLTLLRTAAGHLAGPFGEAVRGLLAETLSDPERTRAARENLTGARGHVVLRLLRRAADRGQVRPEAVTPRVASVAPALMAHHFLSQGAPVPDRVILEIVDEVVLPLTRPTGPS